MKIMAQKKPAQHPPASTSPVKEPALPRNGKTIEDVHEVGEHFETLKSEC
jgi:hypothetical protein